MGDETWTRYIVHFSIDQYWQKNLGSSSFCIRFGMNNLGEIIKNE